MRKALELITCGECKKMYPPSQMIKRRRLEPARPRICRECFRRRRAIVVMTVEEFEESRN